MKAIIPVAGIGSRLKPHTYSQPKPLMPVAGKPILSHIIDQLVEQGIKDFVFVIGYLGERIREYVLETYPKLNVEFVVQLTRNGTGHAIWSVKNTIKQDDEVLIVLGDTIVDVDIEPLLKTKHSCLGIKKVDTPSDFGVVMMNKEGMIKQVIEKPKFPKSNQAIVGIYKIQESRELFEALDHIVNNNITTQDEIQLTDAIQIMLDKEIPFEGYKVNNWFDCGKKDILLETNSILLNRIQNKKIREPKFPGSIIIPPVWIGKGSEIKNSIVGPNVTVGEGTIINYSIVKDSIIGQGSDINHAILHDSVVGGDASIKGLSQSLNIGDNTEIEFSN